MAARNRSKFWSPALALALAGCLNGPGFFKQNDATKTNAIALQNAGSTPAVVETADTVVATLSSSSTEAQLVAAPSASAISASRVSFPPGTLAVDTEITIEEGAPLVSSVLADELGLGESNSISSAGSPVVISSSVVLDAQRPFVVSLGFDSASLNLVGVDLDRLIIAFKVFVAAENKTVVGVIPHSEITIENGIASFEIKYFGVYQPAFAEKPIEKRLTVDSVSPILTKKAAAAAPEPLWSAPAISYDEKANALTCEATLSGVVAKRCLAVADRDKTAPYDRKVLIVATKGAVTLTATDSGNFACRIECTDESGRSSTSEWSEFFKVPARAAEVSSVSKAPATVEAVAPPFVVVSTLPTAGSVVRAVDLNQIEFLLSDTMNTTTLNNSRATLWDLSTGTPRAIFGAIVSAGGTKQEKILVKPAMPLSLGSTYKVEINAGINDTRGRPLPSASVTFSTVAGAWSNVTVNPLLDSSFSPLVARGPDGTIVVLHRTLNSPSSTSATGLYASVFRNGSWIAPQLISIDGNGNPEDPAAGNDIAQAAVGANGHIAVVYKAAANSIHFNYFTPSAAGGQWLPVSGSLTAMGSPTLSGLVVDGAGNATSFYKVYFSSLDSIYSFRFAAGSIIQNNQWVSNDAGSGGTPFGHAVCNSHGDILLLFSAHSSRMIAKFIANSNGALEYGMPAFAPASGSYSQAQIAISEGDSTHPASGFVAQEFYEGPDYVIHGAFFDVSRNGGPAWSSTPMVIRSSNSYNLAVRDVIWREANRFDVLYQDDTGNPAKDILVQRVNGDALEGSSVLLTHDGFGYGSARLTKNAFSQFGAVFAMSTDGSSANGVGAAFDFGAGWVAGGAVTPTIDSFSNAQSVNLGIGLDDHGEAVIAWAQGQGNNDFPSKVFARRVHRDASQAAGFSYVVDGPLLEATSESATLRALFVSPSARTLLLYDSPTVGLHSKAFSEP